EAGALRSLAERLVPGRDEARPEAHQGAIGGSPTAAPPRRGPGTFANRNGAGSRPGCTHQHSPLPSLVAASHIASATSPGRRRGISDVEAVHEVERLDLVSLTLEPRAHRAPEAAFAAGDEGLHGSSTTLPTCLRASINACASPASASGNVAPTSGSISPRAHSSSSSVAASLTSCGRSFISRPR